MSKSRRGYHTFIIWIFLSLLETATSHPFELAIDNQLAIIADDCYTRISIGMKIRPTSSNFPAFQVTSVSECEEECSKRRNSCDVFSFGIDLKGNATCTLAANAPNIEELQADPDYDVYLRSQRTPHCQSDRIYQFPGSPKNPRKNLSTSIKAFSTGLLPNIRQSSRFVNDDASKYKSYFLSTDDDRRISDILANKKHDGYAYSYRKPIIIDQVEPFTGSERLKNDFFNREEENFQRVFGNADYRDLLRGYEHGKHHFQEIWKEDGRDWLPLTFKHNKLISRGQGNSSVLDDVRDLSLFVSNLDVNSTQYSPHFYGFSTSTFNNYRDAGYRFGDRIRHKVKLTILGTRQDSLIILEDVSDDCDPCYRRLFSGKKIREMYIRRAIECQTIDDCHRACDYEKLFDCTGFNYRRASEGARGFCELTSTPYPRVDVQRDFVADSRCDFYEKNFNCRPTPSWSYDYSPRPAPRPAPRPLASPYDFEQRFSNQLPRPLDYYPDRPVKHDRPPYQPKDPYQQPLPRPYPADRLYSEDTYLPRRPDNRYYYDRHQTDYRRRMDYDLYHRDAHRDIGRNEVGKDQNRYWPAYGAVYGSSYPHGTNTIGNFNAKELSHQPGRPVPHQPPRPYENDHFYSNFYNYGGAFGYGGNYAPSYKDLVYGGSGGENRDCSIRAGAGFKLGRAIVRKSFLTPNLDHCESLCVTETTFLCVTFAYRYNVAATDPTDNCLLSDVHYRDLNFYTDLVPDHDYDIYAVVGDVKTCNRGKASGPRPTDECFWRVRSGFGMPMDVTRKAIIVQGIGDCQIECALSQDFTCRSFAFRYKQHGERRTNGSLNCYLSDWPSQEINPADMPDVDGAELYERGSFGRGCEPYSLPSLHAGRFTDGKPLRENQACYSGYHKPCKLTPYAVVLATRAISETDCREKCTRMRIQDPTPCMSFSFRVHGNGFADENCLLSDVPIRDLRPGLDYMHDNEHVLYAWRDLDPRCHASAGTTDDEHVHGVAGYGLGRPLPPGPPYAPDVAANGNGYGYGYGYGSGSGYGYGAIGNTYELGLGVGHANGHRVRPLDPDRPDPIGPHYNVDEARPDVTRPLFPYGSAGQSPYDGIYPDRPGSYRPPLGQYAPHGVGVGAGGDHPPPYSMDDFLHIFRHYTVNGYPCKRGSRCEKNEIAGFWSCEVEGGEFPSWDYCCAPNNRCGYSQGYHYPWCYVGPSEDQWRPCSEKYYPYLPSPRPLRPKQHRFDEDNGRTLYTDYSARHWPVIYVHSTPPPNCTDSIASAANYATTRYAKNARTDRKEEGSRQMRGRRLQPRTISTGADNSTQKNQHVEKSRGNDVNSADLHSSEAHQNWTSVLPARKIAAQVQVSNLAGKIERVEKPSNVHESPVSRALSIE